MRRLASLLTLVALALCAPGPAAARDTEAAALIVAILGFGASPASAQDKPSTAGKTGVQTDRPARNGVRNVTGTVKSATADSLVVQGKERKKEREWAFSIDDKTTIRRRGQAGAPASDIKAGDSVTVSYTERDGKVVAQSVTVNGAGSAAGGGARSTDRPASKEPAKKP
jgi:hypothetical protein